MANLKREVMELKARIERLEAIVQPFTGGVHQTVLPGPGERQDPE